MKIHFLLNSCRLGVGALALRANRRDRNISSPPEEQHLDRVTEKSSRAFSLMLPEGSFQRDRDHVGITTCNRLESLTEESTTNRHGGVCGAESLTSAHCWFKDPEIF